VTATDSQKNSRRGITTAHEVDLSLLLKKRVIEKEAAFTVQTAFLKKSFLLRKVLLEEEKSVGGSIEKAQRGTAVPVMDEEKRSISISKELRKAIGRKGWNYSHMYGNLSPKRRPEGIQKRVGLLHLEGERPLGEEERI